MIYVFFQILLFRFGFPSHSTVRLHDVSLAVSQETPETEESTPTTEARGDGMNETHQV